MTITITLSLYQQKYSLLLLLFCNVPLCAGPGGAEGGFASRGAGSVLRRQAPGRRCLPGSPGEPGHSGGGGPHAGR